MSRLSKRGKNPTNIYPHLLKGGEVLAGTFRPVDNPTDSGSSLFWKNAAYYFDYYDAIEKHGSRGRTKERMFRLGLLTQEEANSYMRALAVAQHHSGGGSALVEAMGQLHANARSLSLFREPIFTEERAKAYRARLKTHLTPNQWRAFYMSRYSKKSMFRIWEELGLLKPAPYPAPRPKPGSGRQGGQGGQESPGRTSLAVAQQMSKAQRQEAARKLVLTPAQARQFVKNLPPVQGGPPGPGLSMLKDSLGVIRYPRQPGAPSIQGGGGVGGSGDTEFWAEQLTGRDWSGITNHPGILGERSQVAWSWAQPRLEKLPMRRKVRKELGKRKRNRDFGLSVRRPERLVTDGLAFGLPTPAPRASILIDRSGSMGWNVDELVGLVEALPGSIIAVYSGNPSRFKLLAYRGRAARGPVLEEALASMGGGNECDYPCLVWLSKQPKPRFWISDGLVVARGGFSFGLVTRCSAFAKKHGIERMMPNDFSELFKLKWRREEMKILLGEEGS